tara:strand:+ start:1310 stop:2293 length:984 start_codon:yes stop_codon:yes gene_type:complete
MAYIGKSPSGTGVRIRYYFTQTSGGATSISGTDDNNKTLSFSDGEYVDVYLNGVSLVAGTDYNTTTANTIGGLSALANGDVVEVVVYDIFTVADTVSQSSGGTFNGGVTINKASHGDILEIQKEGTRFGALGSQSSGFYIDGESGHSGLRFANGAVTPREDLADADNSNDLGASNNRWANLYLGGGAYIGGTGAANYLDDYEEGTFTPSFTSGVDGGASYSYQLGRYTKIGRKVIVEVDLDLNSFSANSSTVKIGTLPFTSDSSAPYGGGFFTYNGGFYNSLAAWFVANNATTAALYRQSDGGALAGNASGMSMGGTCRATIIYTAA